jgi:quinol monooxygenase YgiN
MAVTYIIRFHVKPEQRERFHTLLNGVLDAMRHEPMFHEAVLHAHPEQPNVFLLYETWEDHEDVLNVQVKRPYRAAWHAALDEILAAPREISVWKPVRADRNPERTGAR